MKLEAYHDLSFESLLLSYRSVQPEMFRHFSKPKKFSTDNCSSEDSNTRQAESAVKVFIVKGNTAEKKTGSFMPHIARRWRRGDK